MSVFDTYLMAMRNLKREALRRVNSDIFLIVNIIRFEFSDIRCVNIFPLINFNLARGI